MQAFEAYILKKKNYIFAEVLSSQIIIGSAIAYRKKLYGPQIANLQIATFAEDPQHEKI
jgi:hypothetical protein